MLNRFGHVEQMGGERLTKRVFMSLVRGERGRGRPIFRLMGAVRKACAEREMGLEEAKGVCRDRIEWRMTDRIV